MNSDNKQRKIEDGVNTKVYPNGAKYVGGWRDGKWHGSGTYPSPDGTQYVGEYRDGKKHGQATMNVAGGSVYVGEWKDGERHGLGTYTFPDAISTKMVPPLYLSPSFSLPVVLNFLPPFLTMN